MRSPLTEPVKRVEGMIAYVRENLNDDEYNLFLDLLVPEPEPVVTKLTKKRRKSSGSKSARATGLATTLNKNLAQQRKPMCATCGSTDPNNGDHGTGEGQHEFSTDVDRRLQKLMAKDGDKCAFEIDGKVCKGLEGDAIHDATMGYVNYHEFVAAEAATAGTGGD